MDIFQACDMFTKCQPETLAQMQCKMLPKGTQPNGQIKFRYIYIFFVTFANDTLYKLNMLHVFCFSFCFVVFISKQVTFLQLTLLTFEGTMRYLLISSQLT